MLTNAHQPSFRRFAPRIGLYLALFFLAAVPPANHSLSLLALFVLRNQRCFQFVFMNSLIEFERVSSHLLAISFQNIIKDWRTLIVRNYCVCVGTVRLLSVIVVVNNQASDVPNENLRRRKADTQMMGRHFKWVFLGRPSPLLSWFLPPHPLDNAHNHYFRQRSATAPPI